MSLLERRREPERASFEDAIADDEASDLSEGDLGGSDPAHSARHDDGLAGGSPSSGVVSARRPSASLRPALPANLRSGTKLDPLALAAMPPSLGRDLIETLYGGWLDEALWASYGDLSATDYDRATDTNAERRLYADTAFLVLRAMDVAGAKVRSGTHYRMASTVIAELHGDLTHTCGRCGGTGKQRKVRPKSYRRTDTCLPCDGSGSITPSLSMRAAECECRFPEFRDHLHGAYLIALARLARELDVAQAKLRSLSQLVRPRSV